MTGVIPWLATYEDGNEGKYYFRPTYFRAYYYQSVHWAGVTEGEPDGVDFAAEAWQPFYRADDTRPFAAVT